MFLPHEVFSKRKLKRKLKENKEELVFLPHFLHDFLRKIPSFFIWLHLLREILGQYVYSNYLLTRLGRQKLSNYPANIYLFKGKNTNTKKRCEICSKLTIKTPERCQWRSSCIFIVNFEHIAHLSLVFLLLTLNK